MVSQKDGEIILRVIELMTHRSVQDGLIAFIDVVMDDDFQARVTVGRAGGRASSEYLFTREEPLSTLGSWAKKEVLPDFRRLYAGRSGRALELVNQIVADIARLNMRVSAQIEEHERAALAGV